MPPVSTKGNIVKYGFQVVNSSLHKIATHKDYIYINDTTVGAFAPRIKLCFFNNEPAGKRAREMSYIIQFALGVRG